MATIFRDKVTIGTVTFNDASALPAETSSLGIDVLDGWTDTPEMDALITPWGGQVDGGVASPYFPVRPRYLTVGGYVVTYSRSAAERVRDMLVRDAFPRNKSLRMTRYESTPKWLAVRRATPITFPQDLGEAFRFSFEAVAEDPFKYALEPVVVSANVKGISSSFRSYPRMYPLVYSGLASMDSSDHAVVVNSGTAPAHPIVTIHGPLPQGGWRLEALKVGSPMAETIYFDIGLNTGDELVIDFRQQLAWLNGVSITSSVVGTFWTVEGATTVRLFAPYDPDARFEIRTYSAWE